MTENKNKDQNKEEQVKDQKEKIDPASTAENTNLYEHDPKNADYKKAD